MKLLKGCLITSIIILIIVVILTIVFRYVLASLFIIQLFENLQM